MKIKCIIVDDEPNAQEIIKLYCTKIDFILVEKVFSNAIDAAVFLKSNPIDLVFLDIEMPQVNGINFLRLIESNPKVVFTTAYSEFALEGYEFNVIDYLLKPITFERFLKAVNKIKPTTEVNYFDAIIKLPQLHESIKPSEILLLESVGNYVKIHFVRSKAKLIHSTLKDIYDILLDYNFVRCHKSFIINPYFISEYSSNAVKMTSGMQIPIGISYRQQAREKIKPEIKPPY